MKKTKLKTPARNTPLYGNYKMLHPNGTLLCRTNKKKIDWYLRRNLAKVIDADTIQLINEPSGNFESCNREYNVSPKKNICVACGSEHNLSAHHIVPFCYRIHLPEDIKKHNSYDVMPLCDECHCKYEIEANKLKKELMTRYGIDFIPRQTTELDKAIGYAHTLSLHGDKIPLSRREEMAGFAIQHLGDDFLKRYSEIAQTHRRLQEVQDRPSKLVMEKVDDYDAFVRLWRHHFCDTLQPKHLPPLWKVDGAVR